MHAPSVLARYYNWRDQAMLSLGTKCIDSRGPVDASRLLGLRRITPEGREKSEAEWFSESSNKSTAEHRCRTAQSFLVQAWRPLEAPTVEPPGCKGHNRNLQKPAFREVAAERHCGEEVHGTKQQAERGPKSHYEKVEVSGEDTASGRTVVGQYLLRTRRICNTQPGNEAFHPR
jgi:hypothetical protein